MRFNFCQTSKSVSRFVFEKNTKKKKKKLKINVKTFLKNVASSEEGFFPVATYISERLPEPSEHISALKASI